MVQVNYCLVKQNVGALIEDSPGDYDRYPDYKEVTGEVVFTPMIAAGQAFQLKGADGEMYTVPITRIRGKIVEGKITHEGEEGVPLFAGGEGANPSTVSYRVTYANLRAGDEPVQLNPIAFTAIPGATIDLTTVTPISNAPVSGVVKGDKGPQGERGERGPQGERGERGPQGERGEPGEVTLEQLNEKADKSYVETLVYKGVLADGSDINNIREPGIYTVPSVSASRTMLNYPTIRSGIVTVWTNLGSNLTTQEVTAHVSTTSSVEKYTRSTLSSSSTAWGPWASSEWVKKIVVGTADSRVDVDTLRDAGAYTINNTSYVDGLPTNRSGFLEVFTWPGTGSSMQKYTEVLSDNSLVEWKRASKTTSGFKDIEWKKLDVSPEETPPASPNESVDTAVSVHSARVEYARSRRGGGVGTGGKPVVMLRFDHWLVAFRDEVLPILRKYQLPSTLNMNFDNINIEANGGGSIAWSDVQDWNQRYGVEIANHGSTHRNPTDASGIYHEIVDGRRNLEEAMPRVSVETWQEHGSAYLIAKDIDGDIGLNLGREPKNFFESYAGRLVLAEHAVVEGKTGGFFHPLTGSPQIGQSHYSADRSTSEQAISQVRTAQELGRGLTLYTHPGSMNNAVIGGKYWPYEKQENGSFKLTNPSDGSTQSFSDWNAMDEWAVSGGNWLNMSYEHFDELCDYLATEREAGRLMVMTAAGGAFADKSHSRRENLLVKSDFTDGYTAWWSGTNGWEVASPGPDVKLTATSSAGELNQAMLLHSRFGWAMGATHELVVRASSSEDTTLTLRAEQMGKPENWNVGDTFSVPGDGEERSYRINIALPRDPSISQIRWYIGGPSITIHGVPLLAAI